MEEKTVEKLDRVVVRFAGDSGDGMQLTGSRFTDATAMVGNGLATLPDLPAETARRPAPRTAPPRSRSTLPRAISSPPAIT